MTTRTASHFVVLLLVTLEYDKERFKNNEQGQNKRWINLLNNTCKFDVCGVKCGVDELQNQQSKS